jgi:hypothetical protein
MKIRRIERSFPLAARAENEAKEATAAAEAAKRSRRRRDESELMAGAEYRTKRSAPQSADASTTNRG